MKYKIEFFVECSTATKKELRDFLKNLNFDVNDVVTFPNRINITEIKENKKEAKNKCPSYSKHWGCAISPLKRCDLCPDYKVYN